MRECCKDKQQQMNITYATKGTARHDKRTRLVKWETWMRWWERTAVTGRPAVIGWAQSTAAIQGRLRVQRSRRLITLKSGSKPHVLYKPPRVGGVGTSAYVHARYVNHAGSTVRTCVNIVSGQGCTAHQTPVCIKSGCWLCGAESVHACACMHGC